MGLGDIIVRGTNASNGTAIILAGAIPTALMAILADILLGWLERALSPIKRKKLIQSEAKQGKRAVTYYCNALFLLRLLAINSSL